MDVFCGICLEDLTDEPQVELLCHHFYHTECFLGRHNNNCLLCQQIREHEQRDLDVLAEEQLGQVRQEEENIESARVNQLFDTDEKLRVLLKNYKASCTELSKHRRPLTQLLQRKSEDLHGTVDTLLQQIKDAHRQKKQEVLNSQEYKTYHSKYARCCNFMNRLRRDYQIVPSSFRYLREKRGMKHLRRISWGSDAPRMVRRKLRISAYFR